jgi:hypothetical protein
MQLGPAFWLNEAFLVCSSFCPIAAQVLFVCYALGSRMILVSAPWSFVVAREPFAHPLTFFKSADIALNHGNYYTLLVRRFQPILHN